MSFLLSFGLFKIGAFHEHEHHGVWAREGQYVSFRFCMENKLLEMLGKNVVVHSSLAFLLNLITNHFSMYL